MYEFWYDYVKPKYDKNAKLCYIVTVSFFAHIKTDYIYDVEARFNASNYELERSLPKKKKKKGTGLMKDE